MTATATKDAEIVEQSHALSAPPPQAGLVVPFDGVRMRLSPAEARRRIDEFQAFVKTCLDGPDVDPQTGEVRREGTDYGQMPGTDKKMLYKPGAERICQQFGLAWKIVWREAVKDWQKAFFYFEAEVTILDRETGVPICNAIGSCNSREDRYAWRWTYADRIPKDFSTAGLQTRKVGKKRDIVQFRVPNEDIYSLVNTIQKMAIKRAFVGAVTAATASSGIFASDLDTFSKEVLEQLLGDEDEVRTWSKGSAADKKADLVEGLRQRLADAKTDRDCYMVGVTALELFNIAQITKAEKELISGEIAKKRATPEIQATVATKPQNGTTPKAAESPKPENAAAPPAPKSDPVATKPAEAPRAEPALDPEGMCPHDLIRSTCDECRTAGAKR